MGLTCEEIADAVSKSGHDYRRDDDRPTAKEPLTIPWQPTIGQPEAANSIIYHNDNGHYETLSRILNDAYDHAATGKGKERHARDLHFDKQPMLETTRLVGPGFPLGQAIKKAGEASGMIERGELDAAEAECLGAINYLAGAVAWMRERAAAMPTSVGEAA